MRETSVFAPPPAGVGGAISIEQTKEDLAASRAADKKRLLIALGVLLAVIIVSLHLPYYSLEWSGGDVKAYSPADVLSCYKLFAETVILPVFSDVARSNIALAQASFSDMGMYDAVVRRAAVTFLMVVCGVMLAVSGLMFQSSFRNPLATPTMLGVADGVSLGCIIFVFLGFTEMAQNPSLYMLCAYGGGVIALVVVLILSRFISGGRTYNVFDMLLIGTVIAQLLSGVVNYVTNFGMDVEQWQNFYEIQQGTQMLYYDITYKIVIVVAIVTIIPTVLLSFRLNLISYSSMDGRMLGARPGILRAIAVGLGSIMQLAAIASIGQVAMLSLAVPFLVRYMFGNEFRSQLVGNVVVGSIVLLVCAAVQSFAMVETSFGYLTLPLGTIISFVIMPFFVWMMALQKRGWE